MKHRNIKQELADLINDFRNEFVTNSTYRGLDLNFDTFLMMSIGINESTIKDLNDLANQNQK